LQHHFHYYRLIKTVKLKGSFNKSWGKLIYKFFIAAILTKENSLGKIGLRKCELFLQNFNQQNTFGSDIIIVPNKI
jgi:hypothetical protein